MSKICSNFLCLGSAEIQLTGSPKLSILTLLDNSLKQITVNVINSSPLPVPNVHKFADFLNGKKSRFAFQKISQISVKIEPIIAHLTDSRLLNQPAYQLIPAKPHFKTEFTLHGSKFLQFHPECQVQKATASFTTSRRGIRAISTMQPFD